MSRDTLKKSTYLTLFALVFTGGNSVKTGMLRVQAINKHDAAKQVTALREHPMVLGLKVMKTRCVSGDRRLRAQAEKETTLEAFRDQLDEAYTVVQARLEAMPEATPVEGE